MSCYTKEELENMLQDVVNELGLDDYMIAKHGPRGTAPAVLVKEVLDEKNRIIGGERYVHKEQIEELKTELATLRAKAEAYEIGMERWCVFSDKGTPIKFFPDQYLWEEPQYASLRKIGYTCRKVKVCEVVG